jgi:hypothetical protein
MADSSTPYPRPGSPSPDAILGRCLAVLPFTREAAQSLPVSRRELTPADVQRSKLTAWDDVLPTMC